jgi:hypothetical protein
MRPLIISSMFTTVAVLSLAACGEKPQTGAGIRSDAPAYAGTGSNFMQPGWSAGDKASWEAQLKARQVYGQNEYARTQSR